MDAALRETLAMELQVDPAELTVDRLLSSFELWDSATALGVMVVLGDAIGAPVSPAEMSALTTIGDIEALVRAKKK
jgi:acyl carrier protein